MMNCPTSVVDVGSVKANKYRRFSASNPAERGGIREQKQWSSSPPWCARRQYRIYSDNASVSLRYAKRVDWREYEQRVRQLLDRHVVARDVVNLVEPLNIFEDIAIEARRKEK